LIEGWRRFIVYFLNAEEKVMPSKSYLFLLILVLCIWSCSAPKAAFLYQRTNNDISQPITFVNKSTNAYQYQWNFGDGTYSNEVHPKHQFLSSGRHLITLKATKNNQTTLSAQEIIVMPPLFCMVVIQTTFGDISIKLYDDTPLHRDNFIQLAEQGLYSGTIFHRVIKGFMVQGGDLESKNVMKVKNIGQTRPSYTIPAEIRDTSFHVKGTLAAARQSDEVNPQKASSGSQFYIVQGRPINDEQLDGFEIQKGIRYSEQIRQEMKSLGGAPQLDKEYTIFGKVIQGLDIIDQIAEVKTNDADKPEEDIKIINILIIK
jgi:cyclophilin family peptidyl-prolyl cis-trans isomerase